MLLGATVTFPSSGCSFFLGYLLISYVASRGTPINGGKLTCCWDSFNSRPVVDPRTYYVCLTLLSSFFFIFQREEKKGLLQRRLFLPVYSSCACLYTYCTMQSVCIYSWPAPELGIGTYVLRDPAITKAKNMWADDQEIFLNLLITSA